MFVFRFYHRIDFIQVEGRSLIYAKTGHNSALELTVSKTNQVVRGFAVFTALPLGGKKCWGQDVVQSNFQMY